MELHYDSTIVKFLLALPVILTSLILSFSAAAGTGEAPQEHGISAPDGRAEGPKQEDKPSSNNDENGGEVEAEAEAEPQSSELSELLTELEKDFESISELRKRYSSVGGVARELLRPRFSRDQASYRRSLNDSVPTCLSPATKGTDAERAAMETLLNKLVQAEAVVIRGEFKGLQAKFIVSLSAVDKAKGEDLREAEEERNAVFVEAMGVIADFHASLKSRETLKIKSEADTLLFKRALKNATTTISGQLLEITEKIEEIKGSPEQEGDQVEVLKSLRTYREVLIDFQRAAIRVMTKRGMETSELSQGLIRATGTLSSELLDAGVATGLVEKWSQDLRDWMLQNGPRLGFRAASFALLLVVFWVLGRIARVVVRFGLRLGSSGTSALAGEFFVNMTGRLFLLVGFILGVMQLGVEIGPLLAGLGVAGFVVGFALQNTLSNFASGLMILFYRPFDVGDIVEAGGIKGTVREMNLVSTSIVTFDNQMLVVPNNKIWGDVICNLTHMKTRRVDLEFSIGRGDDFNQAEQVILSVLEDNERILNEPSPVVRLHEIKGTSLRIIARPWVSTPEYWDAYWEITAEVKRRLDKEGMSDPLPQREVRILTKGTDSGEQEN